MFKTASIIYAMQAVSVLCGLVTLLVITRYFSPAEYGRYTLYLSLISLGGALLSNWTKTAFLRYGREEWMTNRHLGEALATELCFVLIGVSIAAGLAWFFGASICQFLSLPSNPWELLVLGVLFFSLPPVCIDAGQAVGRPLSLGFAPLIMRLSLLGGALFSGYLLNQTGWNYLALWYLVGAAIVSLVSLSTLPKNAWHRFFPTLNMFLKILRYSWAIPLATTAAYVVQWVDGWVIRLYVDTEAVGLYNWAYQVIDLGTMGFATLSVLILPRLIDANVNANRQAIKDYAHQAFRIIALFNAILVLLLPFIFPVMRLLIVPEYHPAYQVLLMLTAILPFLLMGYLAGPIAHAFEKLVSRWVIISIVLAAINVTFDLILVPVLGSSGAAIATGIAFIFSSITQSWIYSRYLGIKFLPLGRTVLLCLLPSISGAAVMLFNNLWLSGISCLIISGTILLWFKPIRYIHFKHSLSGFFKSLKIDKSKSSGWHN